MNTIADDDDDVPVIAGDVVDVAQSQEVPLMGLGSLGLIWLRAAGTLNTALNVCSFGSHCNGVIESFDLVFNSLLSNVVPYWSFLNNYTIYFVTTIKLT